MNSSKVIPSFSFADYDDVTCIIITYNGPLWPAKALYLRDIRKRLPAPRLIYYLFCGRPLSFRNFLFRSKKARHRATYRLRTI